mgnify:CR=1 FL=1
MFSRLSYTFREMWASLRRNFTLTAAAVITAAVSLFILGLTLMVLRGFDNQLSQWSGGVEIVVYVENDASPEQLDVIRAAIESTPDVIDVSKLEYLDAEQSMEEARRLFAGDPETLGLLSVDNIPTQFKLVPKPDVSSELLQEITSQYKDRLPKVFSVASPSKQIEVLDTLRGVVSFVLYLITLILLVSAVLLNWDTGRPADVEGLTQGLVGGVFASGGVLTANWYWTRTVESFPPDSGFGAFVVTGNYPQWVVLWLIVLGMLVGAIGSGTAASKFLDV